MIVRLNKDINIDYEKVSQDIEEFRRMGYIPLAELTMDWVEFIAEHLYGKSNNYIRAFMNRYIITDPLISRGHEQRLRKTLLQLLKDTVKQNSLEEAKHFIISLWEKYISLTLNEDDSNEFLVLFLDTEALYRMVENRVVYNNPTRRDLWDKIKEYVTKDLLSSANSNIINPAFIANDSLLSQINDIQPAADVSGLVNASATILGSASSYATTFY